MLSFATIQYEVNTGDVREIHHKPKIYLYFLLEVTAAACHCYVVISGYFSIHATPVQPLWWFVLYFFDEVLRSFEFNSLIASLPVLSRYCGSPPLSRDMNVYEYI